MTFATNRGTPVKCGHCSSALKVLARATKTPKSKAHNGEAWLATFCPRCDRRQCGYCGTNVEQVDAKVCPNEPCRRPL